MAAVPHALGSSPWVGQLFLWPGGALYAGIVADTGLHAHHALQLCAAIEGSFQIRASADDAWRSVLAWIIPPDARHQVDGQNSVAAMLYLDPATPEARELSVSYPKSAEVPPSRGNQVRDRLTTWWQDGAPESEIDTIRDLWTSSLGVVGPTKARGDRRVSQALELLDSPVGWNLSAAELSERISLSPSRFRSLFRAEMGLPVRRYVLWRRLLAAIEYMAQGWSLTEAAHAAEFSDSAHMTRTFRRMFGIQPSALVRHSRIVQVSRAADP